MRDTTPGPDFRPRNVWSRCVQDAVPYVCQAGTGADPVAIRRQMTTHGKSGRQSGRVRDKGWEEGALIVFLVQIGISGFTAEVQDGNQDACRGC